MVDPIHPDDARDALAAELVLGLIEGQERADALRLRLSDANFAALVKKWEARLGPLHAEWAEARPSEAVWEGIQQSVQHTRSVTAMARRLRRWRLGAIGASAVAAVLAVILVNAPAPDTAPTAAPVRLAVARIEAVADDAVVKASYNRTSGLMRLEVSGFEKGPLVPELWVISNGGSPVSLGQFASTGTADVQIPMAQRSLVKEGALLAVTLEPRSAAPHAAPSSPPIASGKLIFVEA